MKHHQPCVNYNDPRLTPTAMDSSGLQYTFCNTDVKSMRQNPTGKCLIMWLWWHWDGISLSRPGWGFNHGLRGVLAFYHNWTVSKLIADIRHCPRVSWLTSGRRRWWWLSTQLREKMCTEGHTWQEEAGNSRCDRTLFKYITPWGNRWCDND